MTFADKHKKGNPFKFEFGEDTQYYGLKEHVSKKTGEVTPGLVETYGIEKTYKVLGFFISTNSMYGPQPNAVVDDGSKVIIVNLPHGLLEEIKLIMADNEDVEVINAGRVGFKLEEYSNRYGDQIGIKWVDLP